MTDNYLFIKKVKETLKRYRMLSSDDTVLVALSGGADSVALLNAMIEIKGTDKVKAAHFNHLLRGEESYRDKDFSENLCKELGVEFFSEESDVKKYSNENRLSIEEAARSLRYRFLFKVMGENKIQKLATGHHLDDNSELVLMNLIRGAGQDGLSGIPPVRDNIIRPFIGVSRKEIVNYLGERKYVNDSSNLDTSILRNRVRLKLLPYIKDEFNPSVTDSLNRLSEILRCDREYFDKTIDGIFEEKCKVKSEKCILILSEELLKLHSSIASRLIRKIIKEINQNLKKITSTHINDVIKIAEKKGSKILDLPHRLRVEKEGGVLYFRQYEISLRDIGKKSGNEEKEKFYEHKVRGDSVIIIPGMKIIFSTCSKTEDTKKSKNIVYFDRDKLTFPLTVRKVSFGDCFRPEGFKGKIKIKKFFNEKKVPEKERWNTPVIVNNNEVIWLCGFEACTDYSVQRDTESVFKVELSLA